ncbi:MAG: ribulose-phosphate 3-epimerase [Lachnospiraceae bacterium]|nr:ribulose-phosphate 3-epimerase [Lachnospiraceae bacterium]
MVNKLAPSILAADFFRLGEQISAVEKAGAQLLHIDVMDGAFVPSISFGMPLIKSIRKNSGLVFDVHLMINEPDRYIDDFAASGADMITVHAEACTHLNRTLSHIREKGLKAGVALNPSTPLNVLDYIYDDVDMILIMSVNPGFGGQKFIPGTMDKLRELKKILAAKNKNIDVQVDGGINLNNVAEVMAAGANVIVSGSSVFNGDIDSNVRHFLEIMGENE